MVMFSSMIWEWSKEHIEEARTSHRLYTISSHDPFHKLAYLKMTHKKGRILLMIYTITLYKKKLSQLKIFRQPASADFWVFSTSCFKFIQQKVEKFPKK